MPIPKKKVESWMKQIQKRMDGVASERDKIDKLISELSDLDESCSRAYEALQEARDSLSELV